MKYKKTFNYNKNQVYQTQILPTQKNIRTDHHLKYYQFITFCAVFISDAIQEQSILIFLNLVFFVASVNILYYIF